MNFSRARRRHRKRNGLSLYVATQPRPQNVHKKHSWFHVGYRLISGAEAVMSSGGSANIRCAPRCRGMQSDIAIGLVRGHGV
jgi:hypothetical protein